MFIGNHHQLKKQQLQQLLQQIKLARLPGAFAKKSFMSAELSLLVATLTIPHQRIAPAALPDLTYAQTPRLTRRSKVLFSQIPVLGATARCIVPYCVNNDCLVNSALGL